MPSGLMGFLAKLKYKGGNDMLKNKNKNSLFDDCRFCNFNELTRERLKDISRFLEYSETDVIKILIDQYYKLQTIRHENEDGIYAIEYLPFYETKESYQESKDDYVKEFGCEYPAIMVTAEDYIEHE